MRTNINSIRQDMKADIKQINSFVEMISKAKRREIKRLISDLENEIDNFNINIYTIKKIYTKAIEFYKVSGFKKDRFALKTVADFFDPNSNEFMYRYNELKNIIQ